MVLRWPTILEVGRLTLLSVAGGQQGFAGSEIDPGWTQGRSSCDPELPSLLGSPEQLLSRAAFDQAIRNSLADAERLLSLRCLGEQGASLPALREELLALRSALGEGGAEKECSSGGDPSLVALEKEKEALRATEPRFAGLLDQYSAAAIAAAGRAPAGLPFDHCLRQAERAWKSARASLNRLSCEAYRRSRLLASVKRLAEAEPGWWRAACGKDAASRRRLSRDAITGLDELPVILLPEE